jgi:hypothetical protein
MSNSRKGSIHSLRVHGAHRLEDVEKILMAAQRKSTLNAMSDLPLQPRVFDLPRCEWVVHPRRLYRSLGSHRGFLTKQKIEMRISPLPNQAISSLYVFVHRVEDNVITSYFQPRPRFIQDGTDFRVRIDLGQPAGWFKRNRTVRFHEYPFTKPSAQARFYVYVQWVVEDHAADGSVAINEQYLRSGGFLVCAAKVVCHSLYMFLFSSVIRVNPCVCVSVDSQAMAKKTTPNQGSHTCRLNTRIHIILHGFDKSVSHLASPPTAHAQMESPPFLCRQYAVH